MKRILILGIVMAVSLVVTGCSSTWDGVKSDTNKAYNSTKQAIHEATD